MQIPKQPQPPAAEPPRPEPPPLKQASVEWVLTALEKAQPPEGATREAAESLVATAEANHIAIEELVEWIASHQSGNTYAFDCWCDGRHKQQH